MLMKKKTKTIRDDEMRPEYDFAGGVRGKYVKRYQRGTNIVLLAPDVASVFHDEKSVNEALRTLICVTRPALVHA